MAHLKEGSTVGGKEIATKSDLTSQDVGKGADMIGLPDPNNRFTATTVRGALEELFTSVSDGKALIAGAITDKGIPTSPSDTFQQMATNIAEIQTGKKYARLVLTAPSSSTWTISGLGFTPSKLKLTLQNPTADVRYSVIIIDFVNLMSYYDDIELRVFKVNTFAFMEKYGVNYILFRNSIQNNDGVTIPTGYEQSEVYEIDAWE